MRRMISNKGDAVISVKLIVIVVILMILMIRLMDHGSRWGLGGTYSADNHPYCFRILY